MSIGHITNYIVKDNKIIGTIGKLTIEQSKNFSHYEDDPDNYGRLVPKYGCTRTQLKINDLKIINNDKINNLNIIIQNIGQVPFDVIVIKTDVDGNTEVQTVAKNVWISHISNTHEFVIEEDYIRYKTDYKPIYCEAEKTLSKTQAAKYNQLFVKAKPESEADTFWLPAILSLGVAAILGLTTNKKSVGSHQSNKRIEEDIWEKKQK